MYDEVVSTYIRVLKSDSPEAAIAIEELLSIYGSRAALRATLVITLLKMEAEKNHSVEAVTIQIHLIKDFPEARPLLERAIAFCLQAWGVRYGSPQSSKLEIPEALIANPPIQDL